MKRIKYSAQKRVECFSFGRERTKLFPPFFSLKRISQFIPIQTRLEAQSKYFQHKKYKEKETV